MRAIRILLLSIILFVSGCSGVKGVGSYKPPILPLKVSVDTNGNTSFELETEIEYPTPLGTFSVGVVVDPAEYFNRDSTLTVRLDCQENFYDLHGRDFSIEFESGYYEKINLAKRGNDILLDVRRIGAGSVICPTPVIKEEGDQAYALSLTQESAQATQFVETAMKSVYVNNVQVLTDRELIGDACESGASCDNLNIKFIVYNNGSLSAELNVFMCSTPDDLQHYFMDAAVEPGQSMELVCPIDFHDSPDTFNIGVGMGREVSNYMNWRIYPYTGKVTN